MAQVVKKPPATQETLVWSLDWEDPLEKGMATHSSILTWRIPWTEEPGGLWSMGSQRVWLNWVTYTFKTSLVAWMVKNLPVMQETWVWSLGREDPLKKGMATHSSILTWKIPWRGEPGGFQSMASQRVEQDRATNTNRRREERRERWKSIWINNGGEIF